MRLGDGAHRRQPLQVEQADAEDCERSDRHAPAVREREHRRAGEHAEPERVLAERRRHDEGADEHGEVQQPARPQWSPPCAAQQRDAAPAEMREHRPERQSRRSDPSRLRGTAARARARRRSAGSAAARRCAKRAAPPARALATAPSSRNTPATGLAHIAASASSTDAIRSCRPGPCVRHQRADRQRDAEQERHPPDRQVGEHAGREQPRGGRSRRRRRRRAAGDRHERATASTAEATPTSAGAIGRPAGRTAASSRARGGRRTTARSRRSVPPAGTATSGRRARPCRRSPAAPACRRRRPARNRAPARRVLERAPHGSGTLARGARDSPARQPRGGAPLEATCRVSMPAASAARATAARVPQGALARAGSVGRTEVTRSRCTAPTTRACPRRRCGIPRQQDLAVRRRVEPHLDDLARCCSAPARPGSRRPCASVCSGGAAGRTRAVRHRARGAHRGRMGVGGAREPATRPQRARAYSSRALFIARMIAASVRSRRARRTRLPARRRRRSITRRERAQVERKGAWALSPGEPGARPLALRECDPAHPGGPRPCVPSLVLGPYRESVRRAATYPESLPDRGNETVAGQIFP